ncbi:hypothetical protein [Halomonas eurihalina]|uniref:hypothetical protein n=1 Tax=Halomonas eurihalina TaxID=42566 RepID=UPI001CAA0180|nr:hypothetical protein [Halomonas eurihalina]MDR5858376.1 hypothetical protein [Halomonas eurihalina]
MNHLYEIWAEMQTIRLETKIVWSDEAHDCFNEIKKRIGDVRGAIWLHFWMKGAYAGPGTQVDNNPDRVAENDKVVYFVSDDDEFSVRVLDAINEVEDFLGPKVRRK